MDLLILIGIFLISLVLHEFSHGLAAYYLGDDTAKRAGRLTLNPLRHIDPFWTVLFPALLFISTHGQFMFGMAKPVPVDFSRLHHPKRDMGLVGGAGPFANFVLAAAGSMLWKLTNHDLFLYAVYLNLGLGIFNMLPIPPLDGSRVAVSFLPGRLARRYLTLEPFGTLIVFVLYFTGLLIRILIPILQWFCRLLDVPIVNI